MSPEQRQAQRSDLKDVLRDSQWEALIHRCREACVDESFIVFMIATYWRNGSPATARNALVKAYRSNEKDLAELRQMLLTKEPAALSDAVRVSRQGEGFAIYRKRGRLKESRAEQIVSFLRHLELNLGEAGAWVRVKESV